MAKYSMNKAPVRLHLLQRSGITCVKMHKVVVNSGTMVLNWESSYAIVLSLMESYPDLDLDCLGIEQLRQMIIALPSFADDPGLANDEILNEILRVWYEEANAG